jgi:hypothetical protein
MITHDTPHTMQVLTNFFAPKEPETGAEAMGVTSQNRIKPSRAIRKRPKHQLKSNQMQKTMDGTELFVAERDCQVCLMKKNGRDVHRAHHKRCPKNTKTNGRGEGSESAVAAEAYFERMAKTNTMPLSGEESFKMASSFSQEFYHGFFASRRMPGTNNLAAICPPVGRTQAPLLEQEICLPVGCTQAPPPEKAPASFGSQQEGLKEAILSECSGERRHDVTMDAPTLQKVLDERITKMAATKSVAPDPIMQLTHHILGMMPNKFKNDSNEMPDTERAGDALAWYNRHFRAGAAGFTFPEEELSATPSPLYHSIAGMTIFFVRWELICPGIHLCCVDPNCCGELIHGRYDFSKNRQLTPIYDIHRRMWACSMLYACNKCGKRVAGNSGELLQTLPEVIRQKYPVEPRYATGLFHLSRDLSDWLEMQSITYVGGDPFAEFLFEKIGRDYLRRCGNYFAQCLFHDWCGKC